MKTRLNYVDNLRTFCIALLIIYHLAMAYNTWGEANYIFLEKVNLISAIVVMISPWFMPLMFLLAGIAASFSIKKRGYGAFIKERLTRLGIPLVAGILFINPILSFIADKTHNGYVGNYLEHYVVFFTKYTDLTGYDGGFTVGHLWFLVVLILFSILGCMVIPIFEFLNKKRYAVIIVNSLLIMLAIALFDVAPCGKRIPTYFCMYLAGYSLFSKQNFVAEIGYVIGEKYQHKGYAKEAVTKMIEEYFTNKNIYMIEAKYNENNVASANLLKSLGFKEEAKLRHRRLDFKSGKRCNLVITSIIKDE